MQVEEIKKAAADVLSQIAATNQPANEILNAYTRTRRYIGSKDRRQLADLVWGVLRHRARLEWAHPKTPFIEKIDYFLKKDYTRVDAPDWVRFEVPEWLVEHIAQAQTELPALLESPEIILRANGNRTKIKKALADEGIETIETALSPYGLILQKRANLKQSACYKKGLVEVQDEASQLVALDTGIQAGLNVLDYCAGAGGKSLILAQIMGDKGKIVAHDISMRSLKELERRAARAGTKIIRTHPKIKIEDYKDGFDHVVVDAPCSGTGTWRRCPDARWKLTPQLFDALLDKQHAILKTAKQFVGTKGRLSYITCSLTVDENDNQVNRFLDENPGFVIEKRVQYSPARTHTDGLYIAVMRRV